MNPDDGALLSAFLVNYGIAGGIFILFCYLRNTRLFSNVYSPLCFGPHAAEYVEGFFDWIKATFRYSQRWILHNRGLDAVMYLRFQKSGFVLFSAMTIVAFLTVIPANAAGPNKDLDPDDRDYVSGLGVISFANVEKGSRTIWLHMVYLCSVTFLFMWLQHRDYQQYCLLRLMHKKKSLAENYTCCIQSISFPEHLYTLKDKTNWLKNYLNVQFDNSVLFVRLVWNEPELEALKEKEIDLQKALERSQAMEIRTGKRSEHLEGINLVESSKFYRAELEKLRHKIQSQQKSTEPLLVPFAFVTFNSIQRAQICAQTNLHPIAEQFETYSAPSPLNVVWKNLGMKNDEAWIRSLLIYAASFFLIVFYMLPITFVQSLANLRSLAQSANSKSLEDFLNENPAFESFFEGVVPPLILLIFMSILLPLLRFLSEQQGWKDQGKVEQSALAKFYFFLVFHVFLATAIAGSLLQQFEDILYTPSDIVPLFSSSLPTQGGFFVTYVLLASAQNFFKLVNFGRLGKILFFQKFRCESEREYREVEEAEEFDFVNELSNDLLIMQITLTYSVMFPIILPFSAAYFFFNILIARYSIVFVSEYRKDTGGQLWPDTFRYMSVGIFICNITMLGVFGLYEFPGAITCTILLILTVIFTFGVLQFYSKLSTYGAIDELQLSVEDDPSLVFDDDGDDEEEHGGEVGELNYGDNISTTPTTTTTTTTTTTSTTPLRGGKSRREEEEKKKYEDKGGSSMFHPFRLKDLEGQELLRVRPPNESDRGLSTTTTVMASDSPQIASLPLIPNKIFSEEELLGQGTHIQLYYAYLQPSLVPPGPPPLPPLRLNTRAVWLSEMSEEQE